MSGLMEQTGKVCEITDEREVESIIRVNEVDNEMEIVISEKREEEILGSYEAEEEDVELSEEKEEEESSEEEEKVESSEEEEEKMESDEEEAGSQDTTEGSLVLNASSLKSEDSMEESIEEGKADVASHDDSTLSSKRNRKKVERFVQETKSKEKDEEVVEVKGDGVKLGSVAYIETMITKTNGEDLKTLHRILFNRPGSHSEVKRNIRKFTGFSFKKDSKEYERKRQRLEKLTIADLKKHIIVLGIEKKGTKPELVERILEFINCPVDQGHKLPTKKKGKGKQTKPKKKEIKEKPKKKESKEKKGNEKKVKVEVEPISDDDDGTSSEEEVVVKPIKKVVKSVSKPVSKKRKAEESIQSSAIKKKKSNPPTDIQIKALVKKILDKANLEEVTMKKVCQQVYDNYPSHNLVPKKEFIKETVKAILS